ncbi:2-hydroxyacid dehydrogenase [Salicibibacter cibarius]|uniref:2-hydroxyacid dehydrogenase n=1 Tax=Salicibibacter cibarius TaxID=2743000 RepID=A0A7T6Z1P6_9BACI|nr:2-hydroxyacid dehydrogenase [Salicibibacter cibarius]QQK75042.1 2-hydroxyacid dehydrogenase [Salicibibacter cibarius]
MKKVIVIGDALVSSETLERAVHQLNVNEPIEVKRFEWYSNLEKEQFQEKIFQIEAGGSEAVKISEGIIGELETANYLLVHIAPVSKKMIETAQKLEFIGTCRGGTEHIHLEACNRKEIPVIHVIRNAEPVADFTLGLMLAETRNIARSHYYIKQGQWVKGFANDPYKKALSQHTVGLLGLGYIGKLVLKRLNGLGVNVIAYDPYVDIEKLDNLNVKLVELNELFRQSDILSIHARLTNGTANLVNKHLLRLMKPGSYIINTARAGLIDRKDLLEVLKEGAIAGAALDVSWTEPLEDNDDFLSLDNVTLTSHIAGDTVDAIPRSPYLLIDVLNDYLKNNTSDMLVNMK